MTVCVAGIILIGIVSCIYNGLINASVMNPEYIFASFAN